MSLKRKYSHEMDDENEEAERQPRSSDAVSLSPPPDLFFSFSRRPFRVFSHPTIQLRPSATPPKVPRRPFIPFRVRLAVMFDGFRMDRYADHVLGLVCDRLQLPELLQECRKDRELIHLPARHRGPYPPPPHKSHHCRPNASVCTPALLATRRSWPWRNSSTILGPITKRAGSLFSMASNDGLCLLFPFPSTCQRPVPYHHTPDLPLPASYTRLPV